MMSLPALRSMISSPALRAIGLPRITPEKERELFLQVALLGMTLTVTALLGYIATRDAEDEIDLARLR